MTIKIAVICGGPSPEADISRKSAEGIITCTAGFKTVCIELEGAWLTKVIEAKCDMVFPMLHGVPGEDGTVQAVLALHNIPFIGCDMAACVAAMDKQFTKNIAAANGVPVIPGFVAKAGYCARTIKRAGG